MRLTVGFGRPHCSTRSDNRAPEGPARPTSNSSVAALSIDCAPLEAAPSIPWTAILAEIVFWYSNIWTFNGGKLRNSSKEQFSIDNEEYQSASLGANENAWHVACQQ
jgi:hypothetical protein